jgi:hypothetical protein
VRVPSLAPAHEETDSLCSQEYATFLHPSFDPNSFAHSIVNNEPYPPPTATISDANNGPAAPGGFMKGLGGTREEGVSVTDALSRLNFGVEDLNRQLKAEVRQRLVGGREGEER